MELRSSYRFPFSRYPAARIALLLISGVWLHQIIPGNSPLFAVALLSACLLMYLILSGYTNRHISLRGTSILTFIYLVLIVLAGWFRMVAAQREIPKPVAVLLAYTDEPVRVYGHLLTVSLNEHGTLNGIVAIESVITDRAEFAVNARFRYRLFDADAGLADTLIPGSGIAGFARPRPFREKRNPHEFGFAEWNYRQQIYGELVFDSMHSTGAGVRGWAVIRHHAYRTIDKMFREPNRPLAKAVILGYKDELDAETRRSFSRAGLSHIMAVSGMHVGFVLMPVWLLFPWLRGTSAGKWVAMALLVTVLIFYAGVTGFTASVTRAGIMAILLGIGSVFCKIRDSMNLVGLAAVILILCDPRFLLDVGFQLSFTAVTIIMVSLPALKRMIPPGIRYTWKGNLITMFGLSVLIQGGLYPVLSVYFREFSLIGPFLNILAVPLAQLLFVVTFITLPLTFIGDQLAATAGIPADLLITLMSVLVEHTNNSVTGWISVQRPTLFLFGIWIFLFGLFSAMHLPSLRWKFAFLLLIMICAQRVSVFVAESEKNQLEAVFFDVGQGDAILIKTPSDRHILYDAGVLSPFSNSGRTVILPYLQDRGINRLDAVILSHPHADHIGGILTLIGQIEIGVIYQSAIEYHSALYSGYMDAARNKEIPVINLFQGDVPDLDPHLLALVLAPSTAMQSRDPNAHSVVIRLQFGETVLLLTGDAEELSERDMHSVFGNFLNSNVLKAGHHGSHTSSHAFFLDMVQPDMVIVSCAIRNRYNHPHRDATERLTATQAELFYTALDGAIIIRSDGKTFRRFNWK